jgi:prepilin-type processing-associated H-X9-DG protein
MVITEENPWSINDSFLATSSGEAEWIDWPSTLHNGGCVLTFGDGHVELHKWVTGTLLLNNEATVEAIPFSNTDWIWLAEHTSAEVLPFQNYPPDN